MTPAWPCAPWVEECRNHLHFALQVFPNDTKNEPARHLLAAGRLAETLGFDAFFLGDHPAWAVECWLHMAALAVTTSRIRLGINVACAGYRHPVMTARLAADLDNLSNGRLILGLGIGWDANEFANLGLPFLPVGERQAALEEALAIIRGVWGDEPFTFHGRYHQTTNAHIAPPPLQRPAPPLMIAGGGERVTLRQVAHFADACNLVMFGTGLLRAANSIDEIRHKLRVLRQHCEEIGRPFDTLLRTYTTGWLILAEDEASVQAKLHHYFPEGLERRYSGPWSSFVFAGRPEQAASHYLALAAAGIQYFIVETLDAADVETIELLAKQVIPAVKRLAT